MSDDEARNRRTDVKESAPIAGEIPAEMPVVGFAADAPGLDERFADDPRVRGTVVRGDTVSLILGDGDPSAIAAEIAPLLRQDMRSTLGPQGLVAEAELAAREAVKSRGRLGQ